MSITRTLIFNDAHMPWHGRSLELIISIAEDIGVDRIIINGDLADFYNISRYAKNPDVQATLEDELFSVQEFLIDLRKRFPKIEIMYIFGNHEQRLNSYIADKCKPFWNIVRLPSQLNLELLKIDFIEYNRKYQLEKTNLFIQHSPPSYSENAAMTSLKRKSDTSFIYGCTHRIQHATKTGESGEIYSTWLNGWCGSTKLSSEHMEVFSYAKGHENWQAGFSVATVINGVDFFVDQYLIKESDKKVSCVVNGFLYEI